jgi:hypothetical protein
MTMVTGRVPGTIGPRRRHPSGGSRSPTQNLHPRVSATIARPGAPRVHVGRLPNENAFRHGFGRYGCRRPQVRIDRDGVAVPSVANLSRWPRWHSGATRA